jgi:PIN domain
LTEELLLVDFENVQQVDLSRVEATARVVIFHGASQKNVPIELVSATQSLGKRIEWVKIEGNGKNALDFHIACYLGRMLEKNPGSNCVVLSKDKGFDPLLNYLELSEENGAITYSF